MIIGDVWNSNCMSWREIFFCHQSILVSGFISCCVCGSVTFMYLADENHDGRVSALAAKKQVSGAMAEISVREVKFVNRRSVSARDAGDTNWKSVVV